MPSPPAAGAEPRLRKRLYGIALQIGEAQNAGKYSKEELRTLARMRVRAHEKKPELSAPETLSKKTAYQRKYRAGVRARVDKVVSRIMTYREALRVLATPEERKRRKVHANHVAQHRAKQQASFDCDAITAFPLPKVHLFEMSFPS